MIVGQRIRRPDAADKVKGTALYVEDLAAAGALLGGVLRSPHAHARIARLDVAAARAHRPACTRCSPRPTSRARTSSR